MKSLKTGRTVLAAIVLAFVACTDVAVAPDTDFEPAFARASGGGGSAAGISDFMDAVNVGLAADGAAYRVAMAEYITDGESGEMGNTVIAKNVGNKQLGHDFVPGDGRRAWSGAGGNAITYAIDTTGDAVPPFGGLGGAATDAAIVRATGTWDALTCSNLGLLRSPDFGIDIGVVAFLNALGGSPFVLADVQHAGWRDINFGGAILGVAFTFVFITPPPVVPTDIDGNGKADTAFREIYYDPSFLWFDDGVSNIDVETVSAHEIGHGLSQAHFGKVFIDKKGNLKFAPKALMNAVYVAPQRSLLGTDNGGHCSNWAQWPNN